MESENKLNTNTLQRVGIQLGLVGMVVWSAALPFSMQQTTRFTAIGLWVMLGGYLIALGGKIKFQSLSKSNRWLVFTFAGFTLFPFLDFWRWEHMEGALSLIVLRLAMLLIPFLVLQFQVHWPPFWARMVAVFLFFSLIVNSLLTISVGPNFLFDIIRSGNDSEIRYWMHRPYYGLYFGIFIIGGITMFYKKPKLVPMLIFMVISGLALVFLWILLSKMAIIGIMLIMSLWTLLRISSNFFPTQKKIVLLGIILIVVGTVYKRTVNSSAYKQIREKGQIDFATVNKNYANSLNLRLMLWQTALLTTFESKAALFGFGTANSQEHLNNAICKVDEHLCMLKLDPHNVWLSEWLQHGVIGLILVSLLFLVPSWHFEENHFQPYMWVWLFVAFCCFSETYVNREMGVQTLVWLAVVAPAFLKFENEQADKGQVQPV